MSGRRRKSPGLGLPDLAHVEKAHQALRRAYAAKTCPMTMYYVGRAEAHIESILNQNYRERFEKQAEDIFRRGKAICAR